LSTSAAIIPEDRFPEQSQPSIGAAGLLALALVFYFFKKTLVWGGWVCNYNLLQIHINF
jgi:hypothetical protein